MNKSQLIKTMTNFTGGSCAISRKQLAACLGYKSPASVDRYLYPLARIGGRYLIEDVAAEVCQQRKWN